MVRRPDKIRVVTNSALWAAYADALGFISELTSESGLRHRLSGKPFDTTRPWKRKIGGAYGATVDLPAGCYSDDTQLRLATGRAIRGDGQFDVEAFAKIELPVWLCYDLGAGPTTKTAAASLANRSSNWFSNFFSKTSFKRQLKYTDGGGNGAAMRVQPHVWASRTLDRPEAFLLDVIRNSVCSHGHPRAILGSVFHAMCLSHALQHGRLPRPDDWFQFVDYLNVVDDLVRSDRDLATFWLPAWERENKNSFSAVCKSTVQEVLRDMDIALEASEEKGAAGYDKAVIELDALSARWRGTGTKTAVLAATLCWCFRDDSPHRAVLHATRLLGTDTDTIATLAGALFGATTDEEPPGHILDDGYIRGEAVRLARISIGETVESFRYPDLLDWKAPKSGLDCVGNVGGKAALAGLGFLDLSGRVYKGTGKFASVWEWATLDFGQTVLCTRRSKLSQLSAVSIPGYLSGSESRPQARDEFVHKRPSYSRRDVESRRPDRKAKVFVEEVVDMFEERMTDSRSASAQKREKLLIDRLANEATASGFNPSVLGRHLRMLLDEDSPARLAMAYAEKISKAWQLRQQREKQY